MAVKISNLPEISCGNPGNLLAVVEVDL